MPWRITLLLAALTLAGCFDVHQRIPGPFLIDDFEDGDPVPSTPLFGRWRCYTFNPSAGSDPEQTVDCDIEPQPGNQTAYGLLARFKLHDEKPTGVQYAGAGVGIWADDKPTVDFSGYQRLSFKMRVDLSDPPPPSAVTNVQLGCSQVKAADPHGTQPYFDLDREFVATSAWQTFQFDLETLTQRPDETNHFADGPESCLKLVDNVRFEVLGAFTVGQSASGVIHIDDVHLE